MYKLKGDTFQEKEPLIGSPKEKNNYPWAIFLILVFALLGVALLTYFGKVSFHKSQVPLGESEDEFPLGDADTEKYYDERREKAQKAMEEDRKKYEERTKASMKFEKEELEKDIKREEEAKQEELEEKRAFQDQKAAAMIAEKELECKKERLAKRHVEAWKQLADYEKLLKTQLEDTEAPTSTTTSTTTTTTTTKPMEECPSCKKVCAKDECKATLTNGLINGTDYEASMPKYRKQGCCGDRKGACDLCCPLKPTGEALSLS